MLDTIFSTNNKAQGLEGQNKNAPHTRGNDPSHAILKMKSNDRMGGSMPVWEAPTTQREKIGQRLDMAGKQSFESQISTAAFADHKVENHSNGEKPFGFGDMIDMVNPLHHLPIIGGMYREATGDEIRGASKIMGGAVFGGGLGAAGGLVNVAVENETGKDVIGNIVDKIGDGSKAADKVEQDMQYAAYRLNQIEPGSKQPEVTPREDVNEMGRAYIADKAREFLGPAVAVADLTLENDTIYQKVDSGKATNGRMAGSMYQEAENIRDFMPPRAPITEIEFSELD